MKYLSIFLLSVMFCLLLYISADAQRPDPKQPENDNLAVPANWNVRLDKLDPSVNISADSETADIFFVNMVPGWHITTGPAGIFYHPGNTAKGSYKASAKIYLFNPQGRNEAFGIFIGGKNLNQHNQSYTYFLLRNSGEYLIKKRLGDETKIVKEWTKVPAMVVYDDTTKSSVPNTLSIEVHDEQVHFLVNGKELNVLAKDDLDTSGIVGLRINHALNVHVEDLSLEKM